MRLAPLVVAACTALLLVASADCQAASAPKRPRSTLIVSRLGGAAAVDGWRYVAWGGGDGQVAVLDDSTGTTMRFGLGQDCDRSYPLSGSHGFFLVNCGLGGRAGAETSQFVLDVTTGEVTALGPDGWDLIGRNWLQGSGDDGVSPFAVYSNWRTGETVTEGLSSSG